VASPTATPTSGYAPLVVAFAANASDLDGDPLTYSWTFGDGGTSNLASPTRTYVAGGTYVAWLTVSDGKDSVTASFTIVVSPVMTMSVASASVKLAKKGMTGDVTLEADIQAPLPGPDDIVAMYFDGIQLFAAPFSAFDYRPKRDTYVLRGGGLVVKIDFADRTLLVSTPSKTNLFGLDPSNGVQVDLLMGNLTATETVPMTANRSGFIYRR